MQFSSVALLSALIMLILIPGCAEQPPERQPPSFMNTTSKVASQQALQPAPALNKTPLDIADKKGFLRELLNNRPDAGKMKAVYSLDYSGGALGRTTGTYTIYSLNGMERMDTLISVGDTPFGGGGIETSIYVLAGGTYTCVNFLGTQCYDMNLPTDNQSIGNMAEERSASLNATLGEMEITDAYRMKVSNFDAYCFEMVSGNGPGQDNCFTSDGMPALFTSASEQGTIRMVLTYYGTDVVESDFALPAAPQPMPDVTESALGVG